VVDQANIHRAVALIIQAIGEDPKREGLVTTPQRVAGMPTEPFRIRTSSISWRGSYTKRTIVEPFRCSRMATLPWNLAKTQNSPVPEGPSLQLAIT